MKLLRLRWRENFDLYDVTSRVKNKKSLMFIEVTHLSIIVIYDTSAEVRFYKRVDTKGFTIVMSL